MPDFNVENLQIEEEQNVYVKKTIFVPELELEEALAHLCYLAKHLLPEECWTQFEHSKKVAEWLTKKLHVTNEVADFVNDYKDGKFDESQEQVVNEDQAEIEYTAPN